MLRADPSSRCASLLLPAADSRATLAILPLFQDQADLDAAAAASGGLMDGYEGASLPYAPSVILDLTEQVNTEIRNIVDFTFLPGFNEPTVAILYQSNLTWTGRLEFLRDTCRLLVLALDLSSATYPVILALPTSLPYDCYSLQACPKSLGGVLILTPNAIIHVDMSSKVVGKVVNGWHKRSSGLPIDIQNDSSLGIPLEASHVAFIDSHIALLVLQNSTVFRLHFVRDGRSLSKIEIEGPVAFTTVPSTVETVGKDFLFVASAISDSALLRYQISDHAKSRIPSQQIIENAESDSENEQDG